MGEEEGEEGEGGVRRREDGEDVVDEDGEEDLRAEDEERRGDSKQ